MRFVVIFISACFALGCNNAGQPVAQNNSSTAAANTNQKTLPMTAHSLENNVPAGNAPGGEKTKWKQSGEPIDTRSFDTAIASAEVAQKKSPNDTGAKKRLGDAYFKRAMALTEARQYASALGDFRRTIKYDPANSEAKDWIDKIIMIYDGMNKEYPKEGEEPPPLPFTKGK